MHGVCRRLPGTLSHGLPQLAREAQLLLQPGLQMLPSQHLFAGTSKHVSPGLQLIRVGITARVACLLAGLWILLASIARRT